MSAFNLRVYGILIHNDAVLVSDEMIKGAFITKFPGGGLEYGEGTRDCLKREFKEETGLEVTIGQHLYTTDYFQPSAFKAKDKDLFPLGQQIISIYYYVQADDLSSLSVTESKFAFSAEQLNAQKHCEVFRFIQLNQLSAHDLTLPIDKLVADLIRSAM